VFRFWPEFIPNHQNFANFVRSLNYLRCLTTPRCSFYSQLCPSQFQILTASKSNPWCTPTPVHTPFGLVLFTRWKALETRSLSWSFLCLCNHYLEPFLTSEERYYSNVVYSSSKWWNGAVDDDYYVLSIKIKIKAFTIIIITIIVN